MLFLHYMVFNLIITQFLKALEIQREEDIDLLCETFLRYAFCSVCTSVEGCSEDDNVSYSSYSNIK